MGFYLADAQVSSYDALRNHINLTARAKGYAEVIQDTFCFQMRGFAANAEDTPVIRADEVWADKLTGSGEEILAGDFVYATLGSLFQSVTANPAGVIGTDYYFCGIALDNADADDDLVLIKFWGDEYDHADRAA